MTEYEIRDLVRSIIMQEVQALFMGTMVSNETESRSTVQRFPLEQPRGNIRSVQPFGFASKAPAGTQAFLANGSNDPTNLNIIGHFDEGNRPALDDGDVALYDAFGNIFKISNGKFQLGSESSSQNMVLGPALMAFLKNLVNELAKHTHPSPGAPPTDASVFTQFASSPIGDGSMLSQKSFTE